MTLEVYSDGSAGAKIGSRGAWAYVVVRDEVLLAEGVGTAHKTSPLFMELRAAREGLLAVAALGAGAIELISDCSIVLDVAEGRFMPRPVGLQASCGALRALTVELAVTTRWVRAHAGHRWNEYVDGLARNALLQAVG